MARRRLKGVLLDLSGTLYQGNEALPGAQEALKRLQSAGFPLGFVTNTSRSPLRVVREKLHRLGFGVDSAEIMTAPIAVRSYLVEHGLRPQLLIHPNLAEDFVDLDQSNPDAVVIGDAAEAFDYANLNRAFRMLLEGAPLIAVGVNRYFRQRDGLSLDAGPFVRALEYAAGCRALILGKPAPAFFLAATKALGTEAAETLMVGDDVAADVNGAIRSDLAAALVRTGKYRPGDEGELLEGAWLCRDLAEVVERLLRE